jgi:release factor glutamine methyltransferase
VSRPAGAPGGGGAGGPEEGVPWRMLVDEATGRLRAAGIDNADQEARWIAERAGGFEAAELVLALNQPVTVRSATFFRQMLDRRATGEPLQYVLGRWPFRSLELLVDRRVLIPRPETEVLAGHAIDECDRLGAKVAVDLGTGSGALALTLLAERPGLAEVWATDASPDAIDVARANLAGLGSRATRGRLAVGHWFRALPLHLRGKVDLVVSNPPYVADGEAPDLPDDVRDWEPAQALYSGPTGLEAIEVILAEAPSWLSPHGAVLLEMAPHQAGAAAQLAREAGFPSVTVWPDLTGRDRILHARR